MKIKTKVAFMGGKQAGCVGLLSMFAADCEVVSVVAYDDNVRIEIRRFEK